MDLQVVSKVILGLWYAGIAISILCLLIQTFLYIALPSSKKLDQKILTQLTIARLLSIVFEYGSIFETDNKIHNCIVIALLFHTDAAVVGWMTMFTRRIYQRLVTVFIDEANFVVMSLGVWLGTLPIGVIAFILYWIDAPYIFKYCEVYCTLKCIVLSLNLLVFCRIIQCVITAKRDNNIASTLKTCVSSFLLLSVTGLQVFIRFFYTDQMPFFVPNQDNYRSSLLILFAVISCYQAIAIMVIFVRILKAANKSEHTIIEKIVFNLKNMT